MKVPFSWLKDYVDVGVSAEELKDKLFSCGFEVEELQYVGAEIEKIDEILFSAGRRGTQMGLAVADFLSVTGAHVADITKDHD